MSKDEVAATRDQGSQLEYSVQLMRIIEAICHGYPLPPASAHLWHYRMAAEYLKEAMATGTPSQALMAEVSTLKGNMALEQKWRYEAQAKVDTLIAERDALTE